MNQSKFSIIIPHYNTPDLLERCVNSIPESEDIQIIIVDDNTFNAENLFKDYNFTNRKNTTIYYTKEGKGAGHARNIGIKNSTGKWLIFADADDYFVSNFSEILEKHFDQEEDIIFLGAKCVMANDINKISPRGLINRINRYEKDKNLAKLLYMYTEPWGKLYKRDFIQKNNILFDEMPVCNDQFFCIQAQFSTKKIGVYNEPIYMYLSRAGSLSFGQKDSLEKKLIRLKVSIKVLKFVKSKGYKVFPSPISFFLLHSKNVRELISYLKVLQENKASIVKETINAIRRAFHIFICKITKQTTSDEVSIRKK